MLYFPLLLGLSSGYVQVYNGNQRYVVTGIVKNNYMPLSDILLYISTTSNSENNQFNPSKNFSIVNSVRTNEDGSFKVSFPVGGYIYSIEILAYKSVLFDGRKKNIYIN